MINFNAAHYSDLLASFNTANLDALLISESFLKPSLPSFQFALPRYVLIRNDRTGKECGGVCIYLHGDLPLKVVSASSSQYTESAESLLLEITVHTYKVLLGVVYCPNLYIDYLTFLSVGGEVVARSGAVRMVASRFRALTELTCCLRNYLQ